MPQNYHIHFITDCTDAYAQTDVEMAIGIAAHSIGCQFNTTFLPVGKFDVLALSYAAAHHYAVKQSLTLGFVHKKWKDIIIVNAAPPKSSKGADANSNNERDNFVLGHLLDGTVVAGTRNGLSLLKPHIKALYDFGASNNGSQFRSRDVLPEIALLYACGFLKEDISMEMLGNEALQRLAYRLLPEDKRVSITAFDQAELTDAARALCSTLKTLDINAEIPEFPDHSAVVQIDEPFSNLKIKLSEQDRASLKSAFYDGKNHKVEVSFSDESLVDNATPAFGGNVYEAQILPRLFDANEGDIVLTLGSSSHILTGANEKEVMAQLIVLQRRTDTEIPYELPRIGSAVRIILKA